MDEKHATFRRNRYFAGRLLSAEDFAAEQQYFLSKNRLHNRLLYGSGIVAGLSCKLDGQKLRIEPGVAIDCAGREIVVSDPVEVDLQQNLPGPYVCLRYVEREVEPIAVLGAPDSEKLKEMQFVEESFELSFSAQCGYAGHRSVSGRWEACGADHEVTLAALDPPTNPRRARRIESGHLLARLSRCVTALFTHKRR